MRCSGPLINFVASFGLSPVVPCFSQVGGTRTVYNIPGEVSQEQSRGGESPPQKNSNSDVPCRVS